MFLAWSWDTDTLNALKMIKPELLNDGDALDRFKGGGVLVRCTGHPNICARLCPGEMAGRLWHIDGTRYQSRVCATSAEHTPRQIDKVSMKSLSFAADLSA